MKLTRQQLAGGEDLPGTQTLSTDLTGAIVPEAMARFFEAVAALYQRHHWERIPSDGHLFQLSCHNLPIEVQLQAAAKGLIPYVPALVSSDQSGEPR